MGCFSFTTADTNKSISIRYSTSGTFPVAVLVPEEFGGGQITECSYEGHGDFGGHDVFELLATWNKKYLSLDNAEKPERENFGEGEQEQKYYERELCGYNNFCEFISDYKNGMSRQKLSKKYGDDWKRDLGIAIWDDDKMRAGLKYPLKIVEDLSLTYEEVDGVSNDCPYQGCL